mmetsp:Transcript_23426/g.72043  ORF Transcript_23426/g.72043 Transcript_23426/m.72043 type:complete len:282 (+) Transcript_23426:632-1477(+)
MDEDGMTDAVRAAHLVDDEFGVALDVESAHAVVDCRSQAVDQTDVLGLVVRDALRIHDRDGALIDEVVVAVLEREPSAAGARIRPRAAVEEKRGFVAEPGLRTGFQHQRAGVRVVLGDESPQPRLRRAAAAVLLVLQNLRESAEREAARPAAIVIRAVVRPAREVLIELREPRPPTPAHAAHVLPAIAIPRLLARDQLAEVAAVAREHVLATAALPSRNAAMNSRCAHRAATIILRVLHQRHVVRKAPPTRPTTVAHVFFTSGALSSGLARTRPCSRSLSP